MLEYIRNSSKNAYNTFAIVLARSNSPVQFMRWELLFRLQYSRSVDYSQAPIGAVGGNACFLRTVFFSDKYCNGDCM